MLSTQDANWNISDFTIPVELPFTTTKSWTLINYFFNDRDGANLMECLNKNEDGVKVEAVKMAY